MALVTDRWYCTLDDLKAELGETGTANDARLGRYVAQASKSIEAFTGRTFYPVTATKYFDAPRDGCSLFLAYEDLLTLTTLTDDAGVITSANYWLYPLNMTPKHSIVLDTGSLGRCFEYDDPQRAISIAGQWGYCDDYQSTGLTLGAAVSSTTETVVVLSGSGAQVGMMLLIDAEAVHVSAVSGNVATVQRGALGTTASTHLVSTAVYRYIAPLDVMLACVEIASYVNNTRTAGGVKSETIGGEYKIEYGSQDMTVNAKMVLTAYQRIGL